MITYIIRLLWAIFWIILIHIFAVLETIWWLLFSLDKLKQVWKGYSTKIDTSLEFLVWNEEGEWKSLFHWALKIKE